MFSVDKDVVKLTGNVRSETEKEYASSDLANLPGVKTVLNNLEIHDNTFHAPPPAKIAGPTGPKTITLAAGTVISVRLNDEIDTKTAQAGSTFQGTTATAFTLGGFTAIPSGTPVTGRIVEAKAAGHFSGSALLGVELVSLRLPAGVTPQDTSVVMQELSNKAQGGGANTAEKAGGGAAFGAIASASHAESGLAEEAEALEYGRARCTGGTSSATMGRSTKTRSAQPAGYAGYSTAAAE